MSHIRVEYLSPDMPLLDEVVKLADRNTTFLGHFPSSCFEREAKNSRILVAITSKGLLAGYVLFRIARNRAVIQQMCVHEAFRKRGVSKALFETLRANTEYLDGIALHCAREFTEACRVWNQLGFIAVDEKAGRGKSGRPLTRFWYDHRHDNLWSLYQQSQAEDKIVVAIDINIAIDLQDHDRHTASLSAELQEEWLQEYISLCITDECFNEADRCNDFRDT